MLTPGTLLGHYKIVAQVGAGGMGEVYRAQDPRLDRDVAIKVLPTELSTDEERRARFEREARAISSLSHPHICTLYDIGDYDGAPFLVMEHLEGETLGTRLARAHGRGLPLGEALRIGSELAEALDAAHRQGILHRDLKPANVMLTRTGAKLLDFGVAKLTGNGGRSASAAASSAFTQTDSFTDRGTIIGTWPYMAPEQLEGKPADPRTDLWALGCVLYEMVTGARAFSGDSQASLITAIMEAEPPPLRQVQPLTPPALERLVMRCLAKAPEQRWATAHDLADDLRWIAESAGVTTEPQAAGAPERRSRPRALAWAAFVLVALTGLTAAVVWRLRSAAPPPPTPIVRSLLSVAPAEELNAGGWTLSRTRGGTHTALAWTPDGSALVFVGRRDGVCQLFVRQLSDAEARPLPGTEGARMLAVRGDGRSVAFWANEAIRQVPLDGGPISVLVPDLRLPPKGMAWGASGQLLYAMKSPGSTGFRIWRAAGSEATMVTDLAEGEAEHTLPHWLPGDATFLYTVRHRYTWGGEELAAQSVATGERTVLLRDAVDARYVAEHLVFMRFGTLYAAPFDLTDLKVMAEPVAMLADVTQALTGRDTLDETGAGHFCVSPAGSLAYVDGPILPYPGRRLVAVDRGGRVTPLSAPVRSYYPVVRVSPGGDRLAVRVSFVTEQSLWIYDLGRGVLTKLPGGGDVQWHLWTPDGQRLVRFEIHEGKERLAWQPADGSAPPERLAEALYPASWSADGRELVGTHDPDIWAITVAQASAPLRPVIQTPAREMSPSLSPDGRWLAYESDVSGRLEVYLQPYPGPGPRTQVSAGGGTNPAWNPNGRELFFLEGSHEPGKLRGTISIRMMGVEIVADPVLGVGRPSVLFEFGFPELGSACHPLRCYDVAPDGQSFFFAQTVPQEPAPPVTHIHLVMNWLEEVKARLAAPSQ